MLHLVVFPALMALLFALTRHREIREEPDNGWRLLVSIPFAYGFTGFMLFTFGFPVSGLVAAFGIFSLVALAAMWRAHVSHFAARKTSTYLYADGQGGEAKETGAEARRTPSEGKETRPEATRTGPAARESAQGMKRNR